MGAGNNLGFSYAKTDYVLLLKSRCYFEKSMIDKIILGAKKIISFAIYLLNHQILITLIIN